MCGNIKIAGLLVVDQYIVEVHNVQLYKNQQNQYILKVHSRMQELYINHAENNL